MIDYAGLPVRVEPMRADDLPRVMQIEQVSFSAPWSARAYEHELRYNDMAYYFVARRVEVESKRNGWNLRGWLRALWDSTARGVGSEVLGYIGFWMMAGEAHISTIAVDPKYRRRSVGELLLVAAMDRAVELGAHEITLEVRASNRAAQELYLKYGFVNVGLRKAYYSDNGEDALIMTIPLLGAAELQQRFQRLKSKIP